MHGVVLLLAYGLAIILLVLIALGALFVLFRWTFPESPDSLLLDLASNADTLYLKLVTDMTGETVLTTEDRAAIERWRRRANVEIQRATMGRR